jgi:hypothetical protein
MLTEFIKIKGAQAMDSVLPVEIKAASIMCVPGGTDLQQVIIYSLFFPFRLIYNKVVRRWHPYPARSSVTNGSHWLATNMRRTCIE